MKTAIHLLVLLLVFATAQTQAQTEATFYVPPAKHQRVKNLVRDYGVDNDFATDDSPQLQRAIDELSRQGGGRLLIPAGNYSFAGIALASGVHLAFEPGAVVRPAAQGNQKNYFLFGLGIESDAVEAVSVQSAVPGQSFTIDLTQADNPNVAVFALRNVEGFYFSDILIADSQTKFSSFTLGITPYDGAYYMPRNGIIRNCQTTNADYGYGLVQAQAAKNVLFENLQGQGGVTLRLETGETKMNNLQQGGLHDIVGRGIACTDGNAAVMISPHAMRNGIITIDGVEAVNSGFAVRIDPGFVSNKYRQDAGLVAGSFDPRSSVRNVTATFGTRAQVKPKHFRFIPAAYQTSEHTAETPITNVHTNPRSTEAGHAVFAVSVAAVGNLAGHPVECETGRGRWQKIPTTYTIQLDESTVRAIGFAHQQPVIDLTDDVTRNCRDAE